MLPGKRGAAQGPLHAGARRARRPPPRRRARARHEIGDGVTDDGDLVHRVDAQPQHRGQHGVGVGDASEARCRWDDDVDHLRPSERLDEHRLTSAQACRHTPIRIDEAIEATSAPVVGSASPRSIATVRAVSNTWCAQLARSSPRNTEHCGCRARSRACRHHSVSGIPVARAAHPERASTSAVSKRPSSGTIVPTLSSTTARTVPSGRGGWSGDHECGLSNCATTTGRSSRRHGECHASQRDDRDHRRQRPWQRFRQASTSWPPRSATCYLAETPKLSSSARTRWPISSRIGRTAAMSWPAGSSRSQSS